MERALRLGQATLQGRALQRTQGKEGGDTPKGGKFRPGIRRGRFPTQQGITKRTQFCARRLGFCNWLWGNEANCGMRQEEGASEMLNL